jgi:uncharacterized protein (TIGR03437 family)
LAILVCLTFVRMAEGRDGDDFKFTGTIQVLPGAAGFIGDWTVSGRKVTVTADTEIDQDDNPQIKYDTTQIVIGATVDVEGTLQNDGSVRASEIKVKSGPGGGSNFSFSGNVEDLPDTTGRIGDWKISGTVVHVSASTLLKQDDGSVAVGSRVDVDGARRADSSVDAYKIEVKSDPGGGGNVQFKGTVESLPSAAGRVGQWSVSGRKVNVTANTNIKPNDAAVAVGFSVQVKGAPRQDGSIDATDIEVQSMGGGGGSFVEFDGVIETLPGGASQVGGPIGAWTVSGRKVNVTAATKIDQDDGPVTVGSPVEVKGGLAADGSVNATKIEVKSRGGAFEFYGAVESLPAATNLIGDWRVAGRTVHVTGPTRIEREYGVVTVGAYVDIFGASLSDGSINATKIEIKQGASGGGYMNFNPATTVSSASYREDNAPESIVSAFGSNMSSATAVASALPLPLSLGDVTVIVDGRQTGLFFVSPNQINYQVPPGTAMGSANVVVMSKGQAILQGAIQISSVALNLFTADSSGTGPPAGILLRVKTNGQQVYESLARIDPNQNKLVPAPIIRRPGEQLFLILFGSGLNQEQNTDGNSANGVAENIQVTIGGVPAPVIYAGTAPGFVGLDQINVQIPDNAPANPTAQVVVQARDLLNNFKEANPVVISLQ